ncbi:MAG: hypothetical protein ABJI45_14430 [Paracoccaceae bacterium]
MSQRPVSPLFGGLSGPFPKGASEVAGIAISKPLCNFSNAEIVPDQQLEGRLTPGAFDDPGKGRSLLQKQTLKRSGADLQLAGDLT